MNSRKLNSNNVPWHIHNQLLKFKSFILQLHYGDDEDFIEEEFSDENLLKGNPAPFMQVLNFCLNNWSSHIAKLVLKLAYSFEEKTDWNFMETVFSFIRNVMKTQPGLSLEQFFSQGYTLPKLKMVNATVQYLVNQHIELRKKDSSPKRIPRIVLAQRSEQWVQQRQTVLLQSPMRESQIRAQPGIHTQQDFEIQKVNVTPKPSDCQSPVGSLVTPNHMVRATTPTEIENWTEVQGIPPTENASLLRSAPSTTSACPKLTPLPSKLLSRVRGYINARPENTNPGNAPTLKAPLNERSDSAQSSNRVRLVPPKDNTVALKDLSACPEQVVSNVYSPQCDVSLLRWEEATESIRQLKKQVTDLKSTQEAIKLNYDKRISELEKHNRELSMELGLCSSRIELIAEKHPMFLKQQDRLRRPLAKSAGSRQFSETLDETKHSQVFSRNIRVNPSLKYKSFTLTRPHTSAYARPVARAATSVEKKPVLNTSGGKVPIRELSKPDIGLRVQVSGNYDKLMELMKDRYPAD